MNVDFILLAMTAALRLALLLLVQDAHDGIDLYPVRRAELFGYANGAGDLVIEPAFESARPFSEGLAGVAIGGEWVYIGADGKQKIEKKFRQVSEFREGLAVVLVDEGYRFIDRTGRPALDAVFVEAEPFSDGVAAVRSGSGWRFIDRSGRSLIELGSEYDRVGPFANGVAPARIDGLWTYIDEHGDRIYEQPMFTYASSLVDEVAVVHVWRRGATESRDTIRVLESPRWGVLKLRHLGLAEGIDELGAFSGDRAPARAGMDWGFVGRNGDWVIPPLFSAVEPFRNGLARVIDCLGRHWYVDAAGSLQFEANDQRSSSFDREGGLVLLEYSSAPPDAEVFLLPKYAWERVPELREDYSKWTALGLPTNGSESVAEKRYKVAFRLGDRSEVKEIDVQPTKENRVHAKFE